MPLFMRTGPADWAPAFVEAAKSELIRHCAFWDDADLHDFTAMYIAF